MHLSLLIGKPTHCAALFGMVLLRNIAIFHHHNTSYGSMAILHDSCMKCMNICMYLKAAAWTQFIGVWSHSTGAFFTMASVRWGF